MSLSLAECTQANRSLGIGLLIVRTNGNILDINPSD